MPQFVYIMQSLREGGYYIGETSDVESRILFHNSGRHRSTKNRILFRLVLTEEYPSREEALQRERQITSWKEGEAFKNLVLGM